MAVVLRVDVDSSYGRKNLINHFFSKLTSDLNLPSISILPYLAYLNIFIDYLNDNSYKAYFFFRKCTLPNRKVLTTLNNGNHVIGLHLENSRSFESFKKEIVELEKLIDKKIEVFTKHGSGQHKYGFHHYPPYEPEKYLEWGSRLEIKIFMGNLEDPSFTCTSSKEGIIFFPSAFWLEPYWRDTKKYDINWLINESNKRHLVLLIHAENIIYNKKLFNDLDFILSNTGTTLI